MQKQPFNAEAHSTRLNKTDWFFLSGSLTKLNARLAIRQRADLFISVAVVVFRFQRSSGREEG